MSLIRALENATLRSWPALEIVEYDGWQVRFAQGYTRRSNCVSALDASALDLDEKLAHVEALYRQRALPARFKLTPQTLPPDLDARLAARGYVWESGAKVMQADLAAFGAGRDAAVTLDSTVSESWLDDFCRLNESHAPYRTLMPTFLGQIALDKYFARLGYEGQTAALGLGVREGGYIGLYDIVTHPALRGRGFGRRLVWAILDQAAQAGATTAYLQVVDGNTPAIKLYEGLGFTEAYPYWYRAKTEE